MRANMAKRPFCLAWMLAGYFKSRFGLDAVLNNLPSRMLQEADDKPAALLTSAVASDGAEATPSAKRASDHTHKMAAHATTLPGISPRIPLVKLYLKCCIISSPLTLLLILDVSVLLGFGDRVQSGLPFNTFGVTSWPQSKSLQAKNTLE